MEPQTKKLVSTKENDSLILSDDCLFEIFQNLRPIDIKNTAAVCKRFSKVCNSNLWKKLSANRWGINVVEKVNITTFESLTCIRLTFTRQQTGLNIIL